MPATQQDGQHGRTQRGRHTGDADTQDVWRTPRLVTVPLGSHPLPPGASSSKASWVREAWSHSWCGWDDSAHHSVAHSLIRLTDTGGRPAKVPAALHVLGFSQEQTTLFHPPGVTMASGKGQ